MRNLDPKIPLQEHLAQQLYKALQGDVINDIRMRLFGDSDLFLHSDMKSHSLPVKEKILPELYALCHKITEDLGFQEPIDFYITGASEVNASAIGSDDPQKQPHVIEINSALFNLMSDDELRYIIGHEVGHLINRDSSIRQLFHFIYPTDEDKERVPEFVANRFDLWRRIAELSADRYGYMACENLDACISAIFKMASGLHLDKMKINITDLMEVNNQHLDFLLNESMNIGGSHPVNPVRIQALHLFAKAKTQKALAEGMESLMDIINHSFFTDTDYALAEFHAALGMYMSGQSGKLEKRAEELILNKIAEYSLEPHKVLKTVAKADFINLLQQHISAITDAMPSMCQPAFMFAMELAFIDDILTSDEVECIFEIGKALNCPEEEISRLLTIKIRAHFEPQASSMK